MAWDVEVTDQFTDWYYGLEAREQSAATSAIDVLQEEGPSLGRPLVDTIQRSRFPNMKELRPPSTNLRILFVFDPRRVAILLIGGDKTGQWEDWYDENIPVADDLYNEHLAILRKEGLLP